MSNISHNTHMELILNSDSRVQVQGGEKGQL